MRAAMFETIVPAAPPTTLPLSSTQTTSIAGSLGKLAFLLPAAAVLLSPFLLLADHLIAEPASRQLLLDRPASLLQLVLGLAFWLVLFAWPAKRLLARIARARVVAIADGVVSVAERGLLGRRQWSRPVVSYSGVVHVVRSSLSGSRHELMLLHPERSRSVLLAACDHISETEVREAATLLQLPVVPASVLYRRRGSAALPQSWHPGDAVAAAR